LGPWAQQQLWNFPTNARLFCDKPAVTVEKIKETPCIKVILIIPLMCCTHLSAVVAHLTAQYQGKEFQPPILLPENPMDQGTKSVNIDRMRVEI
jgi:hypothetical protein